MPTRIKLDAIRSLTFYKDASTESRRGQYVTQLNCIGKPCKLYTPDVVRCQNAGGSGTDVDWKCEADLPESLRFGRVEVSCEGWSGPGDVYVLKESCALDYRLVQVPSELRGDGTNYEPRESNVGGTIFMVLWLAVLAFIVYSFYQACARGGQTVGGRTPGGAPGGGGFFPGGYGSGNDGTQPPPPPYSKHASDSTTGAGGGWRPGFWTGILAGAGGYLLNDRLRGGTQTYEDDSSRRRMWDWERDRNQGRQRQTSRSFFGGGSRRDDDRGEGSSNLGAMRSSTGLGSSRVR